MLDEEIILYFILFYCVSCLCNCYQWKVLDKKLSNHQQPLKQHTLILTVWLTFKGKREKEEEWKSKGLGLAYEHMCYVYIHPGWNAKIQKYTQKMTPK